MMWRSGGGGVKAGAGGSSAEDACNGANCGRRWIAAVSWPGQVAVGKKAVAFASVERVLAAPGAKDHFGMVQEVAVDGHVHALDGNRGDAKPVRIDMVGRLAGCPLA